MHRHLTNVTLMVALTATGLGCASAGGPANTGPGSAQYERRLFAGQWALVSYTLIDQNGQTRPLEAAGRFDVDAFGNVEFNGAVEDPNAANEASPVLNGRGRLVIDAVNKRYLILDIEGNLNLGQGAFASAPPESFRYYELRGNELRVEVRNAAGQVTARIGYEKGG